MHPSRSDCYNTAKVGGNVCPISPCYHRAIGTKRQIMIPSRSDSDYVAQSIGHLCLSVTVIATSHDRPISPQGEAVAPSCGTRYYVGQTRWNIPLPIGVVP